MKLDFSADKLISMGITVLKALIILVAGHYLTLFLIKLMKKSLKKLSIDISLEKFFEKALYITLHIIIILSALSTLGISTSGLLAALSAAAVAVALALKDSLSSIAGGIILLLTRRFQTGDYVCINGESGNVVQIDMMHTVLKTLDNRHVVIPNSIVVNSQVVDYSSEETRRLDLTFSVSYDNDTEAVKRVITDTVLADSAVFKDPAPFVGITEYAASSVDFTAQVWCKTSDYLSLSFRLREEMRAAFDENGISIPYNQLDVHIKND